MRMADYRIAGRDITLDERRVLYNQARRLQAEAVRDYFLRAVGAAGRGARWLASTGRSLLLAFREARAAQRAYHALSRLSDRELRDLGIARSEIPAVAWGAPRGIDEPPVIPTAPTAPAREEAEAAAPAGEEVEVEYRKAA